MEKEVRELYPESNAHNCRYITFHFFGAEADDIVRVLDEVYPDNFKNNGYIYEKNKYAHVDVTKALTCEAELLSEKLPDVRVYAENGWTEVEDVTMTAYLNGEEFDEYMIAKPEELNPDSDFVFGEYDEFNELYYGILTIIDIETGEHIEFGCSGVDISEIEELKEIIRKHPYDKGKDKERGEIL